MWTSSFAFIENFTSDDVLTVFLETKKRPLDWVWRSNPPRLPPPPPCPPPPRLCVPASISRIIMNPSWLIFASPPRPPGLPQQLEALRAGE